GAFRSGARVPAGGADGRGAAHRRRHRGAAGARQSQRNRHRAQARRGHRADRRAVLPGDDLLGAATVGGGALVTEAAKPVLRAADVSVRLAGNMIVDRAALTLNPGEFAALIGPNGAGKTTLMRALAGLLPADG